MIRLDELYPDMFRDGDHLPALVRDQVLAYARRWPVITWVLDPRHEPIAADMREASDVLAVIGAIVLSSAARRPLKWDGSSLRGLHDPIELLRSTRLLRTTLKGDDRIALLVENVAVLSFPPHIASKFWAGQQSDVGIWRKGQEALFESRISTMGATVQVKVSPTGYDWRAVASPVRDGFAVYAHEGQIALIGGRPAVELYALIGAAWLESRGRWPRPATPLIPVIEGVVLRDALDLDRLAVVGDVLRVNVALSGKRSFIECG